MNAGSPASHPPGHARNSPPGPRYGHVTGTDLANGTGDQHRTFQVRDDETGGIYAFGYADIVTEGFRSLRAGEGVRFLADPSRLGRASYIISLDLPDIADYYR